MKKKIIGIAVFLFAALFMFTFANPASETEEKWITILQQMIRKM